MKPQAIACAAAASLLLSGTARSEIPTRPDILLIMPDQMRGDCLSILGHAGVSTPQMDQLAGEGVLFQRAYTTVPSCIPARHALLTGKFPQTSGMVGYRARPISVPTMPGLLADAGYATVLVGRNMHQIPRQNSNGYQQRILGSASRSGDGYDTYLKKLSPESGSLRKLVAKLGISNNGWKVSLRCDSSCSSKDFQKVMISASLFLSSLSTVWPTVLPSLEMLPLFNITNPPTKPVSEW